MVQERPTRPIRVLIVDDSLTMRRLIRTGIETDPLIQVVGEASTAREARDAVKALAPDAMTLDIAMPGMDGLEFLSRLMAARPMPVVMISSLTSSGSESAIQAMRLGAIDCIEKPKFGEAEATFSRLRDLLVKSSYGRSPRPVIAPTASKAKNVGGKFNWNGNLVLIGSSTGGVEALETIFRTFPEDCPPTYVTQHMPAQYVVSFASRLNATVRPNVSLARAGDTPEQGQIKLAPGGEHHLVFDPIGPRVQLSTAPKRNGHRPSVDEMFCSAVPFAQKITAIVLTGMGNDGAEGMKLLGQNGAYCIAQDEASSVVYGMPRAAFETGAVDRQLPLGDIAADALRSTMGAKKSVLEGQKCKA